MRFYIEMQMLSRFLRSFTLSASIVLLTAVAAAGVQSGKYLFYVGTYTEQGSKSKGIYAFSYDAANGNIENLGLAAETTNPSWLAISPNGRFLYAVNEVQNYKGPNSGGVSAFSIDRDKNGHANGKLTFLNEVRSGGADPCYVTVDKTGKWVLIANYTGGSVAVFPVRKDGSLGEPSDFVQHEGHGSDPKRQQGPHAHSINLSPDNKFAFVDDLGLDEFRVFKFDAARGGLTMNIPPVALDPGTGPRHFTLYPNGTFAYIIGEMKGTVTVLQSARKPALFEKIQTVSTLPADFKGEKEDAEIEIHPSGRFLFTSNRGEANTIAVFAIDPEKGTLSPVQYAPTEGKTPRSFAIDPTGRLLFAENQNSNSIVVLRIDQKTGRLTPTGKVLDAASPVCIKFLPID